MNFFSMQGLFRRAVVAAAAAGLVLSVTGTARAFTLEGQAPSDGDRHGLTDLQMPGKPDSDSSSSRFDSDSHTFKNGNTTLQFGAPQSFDQRYNPNNLFDPFAREGR